MQDLQADTEQTASPLQRALLLCLSFLRAMTRDNPAMQTRVYAEMPALLANRNLASPPVASAVAALLSEVCVACVLRVAAVNGCAIASDAPGVHGV